MLIAAVALGSCSGERGNVLGVGNYCYVAVCSAALGAEAPTEGEEGRGHIVAAARLQLVFSVFDISFQTVSLLLPFWIGDRKGNLQRFCFEDST